MAKYSRCTYQAVAKIIADEFCWARDSFGVQQQRMFDAFDGMFKRITRDIILICLERHVIYK